MTENKKVGIIGAGIAGLSAACYLQMNGYDTDIYELHTTPGGLCTSWKREDYTFDGCIHWLMGSNPGNPFYNLWNELIKMDEIQFIHHDTLFDIEVKNHKDKYGNNIFHLYSNINQLEKYMKDIAPEDSVVIDDFIESIRELQKWDLPPNIEKAPELLSISEKLKMLKLYPFLKYVKKWKDFLISDLVGVFKNPFIRDAFLLGTGELDFSILVLTMQLANFDKKTTGYPIGGSMVLSRALEKKFISLGGNIHYKSKVQKIIVEDNTATGVILENGEKIHSDYVISAADGKFTIFEALEGKYVSEKLLKLYNEQDPYKIFNSGILVSLGVAKRFDNPTHQIRFELDEPYLLPDGTSVKTMDYSDYYYDPTLAPPGKSVLNVLLITYKCDYWESLRERDKKQYNKEKNGVAEKVINILEKKLPGLKDSVEVVDVATPATFKRYTNNWNGSIQGWMPPADFLAVKSVGKELPGLKNFYMIGQWVTPGGGLPPAILDGRNVAQLVCKQDKMKFNVN